jgi:hypothetical protein
VALKTFVTGEVLTASDTNVYLKNTLYAEKTATETVTSSTAFQDDDHMTVSVAANSVYELTFQFIYDGATGGDLKYQFVGPAGATASLSVNRLQTAAASSVDDAIDTMGISTAQVVGALGAGTFCTSFGRGLVRVSSTAGTFKVQWAQNTSSGTATSLFADSYICLRRVS